MVLQGVAFPSHVSPRQLGLAPPFTTHPTDMRYSQEVKRPNFALPSKESFRRIILTTILCLLLDFQGIHKWSTNILGQTVWMDSKFEVENAKTQLPLHSGRVHRFLQCEMRSPPPGPAPWIQELWI